MRTGNREMSTARPIPPRRINLTTAEKTLPLAHLGGEKPLTSSWLHAVLGHEPERSFIPVDGADIELLTWEREANPACCFCMAIWPMPTGGALSPHSLPPRIAARP
jgi:hypothetical protein